MKSDVLRELFEGALLEDRRRQQEEYSSTHPQGKVDPSISDFLSCPRKVWYSLKGYEETNPPGIDSLSNFLLGHAAEEGFARVLSQFGTCVIPETRVTLDHEEEGKTTGRVDFLVVVPELKCIVELKTTKQKQASYLPIQAHVHQLNGYLHAAKKGQIEGIAPEDAESGVLFYWFKDAVQGKPAFRLIDVEYDEGMVMSDLASNEQIYKMARYSDVPPSRPYGYIQSKFPCSYCGFNRRCWP